MSYVIMDETAKKVCVLFLL